MEKNAKEEKLVYERPKIVELDTPSASGGKACNPGSVGNYTTLLGPSPGPKST